MTDNYNNAKTPAKSSESVFEQTLFDAFYREADFEYAHNLIRDFGKTYPEKKLKYVLHNIWESSAPIDLKIKMTCTAFDNFDGKFNCYRELISKVDSNEDAWSIIRLFGKYGSDRGIT